jgi:hypothetical protein
MLEEAFKKADPSQEKKETIHRQMDWLFNHVPLGKGVETKMRQSMPPLNQ